MPVYEYYCPICDARFSHLARGFDEPPPPCPGCGSRQVDKLVSRVHLGRSEAQRQADLKDRAREVDQEDPREIARFLQQAGSVADEAAPVDPEAFREILARRAEGASDEDLEDVVNAMPFADQTAGHPHEHEHDKAHDHGPAEKRSSRRARDLGWA